MVVIVAQRLNFPPNPHSDPKSATHKPSVPIPAGPVSHSESRIKRLHINKYCKTLDISTPLRNSILSWPLPPTSSQATMYAQKPATRTVHPIRKISPKSIQTPPLTPENWQHLLSIVVRLVQEKQVKDSVISDLATRMTNLETNMDNGIPVLLRKSKRADKIVPVSDTFTFRSVPAFLRGRLRKSFALISKPLSARSTRRSSYRLTFHQYLGVPGLGIGVSHGKGEYRHFLSEEILFLAPSALEVLATSIAGEKERKLPDILLKYMQVEKREFVRDWMRGYINLEKDDEEYVFSIDNEKAGEKDIWIEYVGLFDGMGTRVGEGKLGISCGRSTTSWRKGGCGGDSVVDVPVSRMDVVI